MQHWMAQAPEYSPTSSAHRRGAQGPSAAPLSGLHAAETPAQLPTARESVAWVSPAARRSTYTCRGDLSPFALNSRRHQSNSHKLLGTTLPPVLYWDRFTKQSCTLGTSAVCVAVRVGCLSFGTLQQTGAELFHQTVLEQWKPSAHRSFPLHKTSPVSTGSKALSAMTSLFAML